jgi:hypothetical protein
MLEKYADQIIGAVLTGSGAILTAVLAWSYKRATEWWKRPHLAIEIGNGEDHIYKNVLIKSYIEREAIFVRVKITNKEGDKARGCVGYLAGLEKWEKPRFVPTDYQDFLRLEWSFNKETLGMDLLPGIPVWLDVVYVLPPKLATEQTVLKIASNPPVNRYANGFGLPGMYRVNVQISGDNFAAKMLQFYLVVQSGSVKPEILDVDTWRRRLPKLKLNPDASYLVLETLNSSSQ